MTAPVRIVFLGGLGEIGRNCFLLEVDNRILVVDCGLMFPDADMPGVDLVLPDFTYLREHADRVDGVILTHGHEDHVGGVGVPAARRVRSDLRLGPVPRVRPQPHRRGRHALAHRPGAGTRRRAHRTSGPFDVEFVPVSHSVPHAFATAYRTPAGTILHTGDFKIDLTPVDGRMTDLPRLGQIAGRGRSRPPLRLHQRRATRVHAVGSHRRPGDPRHLA